MIEDDENLSTMLSEYLRGYGFELIACPNAAEGLAELDLRRYAALFLDVMLPGPISGYEICRRFREQEGTKGAHIVIVTARTGPVVERTTEQAGADELIYKPFRLKGIEEIIVRVCGAGSG